MPNLSKPGPLRLALLASLALPALAAAQSNKPPGKKLYCWEERGQRVCSDTVPPEAMGSAREEISASSGMRTGGVERALTTEERAAQADEEARRRTEALALETRRRTDQAMLVTFQDEDELRRVFSERIGLVDNSIQTARYNVTSLREGLVTLLRTAGERELGGKPVPDPLAEDIRQRHAQLLYNQLLQRSFENQRVALDTEIADILERFRVLKANDEPGGHASMRLPPEPRQ